MAATRAGRVYLAACAALLLYVGLVTGFRQNHWAADAWEHHRAIKAMVEDFASPGNPTLLLDTPSIRYSPYTALLALVSLGTGLDPYDVLSGAAVVNTALVLLGLWLFLRAFGHADDAPHVLPFLLFFYGYAPAYANSLALTDLPWHQVNPSACGVGLALIAWTLVKGVRRALHPRVWIAGVLLAFVLLGHAMTGLFMLLGLALMPLVGGERTPARAVQLLLVTGLGFGLALLWPWYDFGRALLHSPDTAYWFDSLAVRLMLTNWCLPGLLVLPAAWVLRREPLVRLALAGTLLTYATGALAFAFRSPTLGRLPLVGLLYAHIGLGVFAARQRLFTPRGLYALVRGVLAAPLRAPVAAWCGLLIVGLLLHLARWQLLNLAWRPHLGRPLIAPLLGKEPMDARVREVFDTLLAPVGARDVVLADLHTSWPIPSSKGRIVAALHYEFYAEGQPQRVADVERFFGEAPDEERRAILQRYGVRWIVLRDPAHPDVPAAQFARLLEESAVVGRGEDLVLMDAAAWAAARS